MPSANTDLVFVLVHCPLVGLSTWLPVAQELERRGYNTVVPSLLGIAAAPTTVAIWCRIVEANEYLERKVLRCRYSNSDQLRDLLGQLVHDLDQA